MAGLEVVHDAFIVVLSVEHRVACLVATSPVVRYTAHVWISRMIDCGHKPLRFALAHVGDLLACILRFIGDSVAIQVVVSLDPIHQGQLHWNTNIVLDENSNVLFIDARFVGTVFRRHADSFRRCCIHTEGTTPVGIWCHDMRWITFVVRLNFVIQAIRNIDVWSDHADEE